jgi:hypothetical protein
MVTLLCMALFGPDGFIRETVETAAVIEHCNKLWEGEGPHVCFKYIMSLGEASEYRTLWRIYSHDDTAIGAYAAYIANRQVGNDQAVAFCKQFKVGSARWVAVFERFDDRPKAAVMPYIRELCATGDARVRYRCYRVCCIAGWNDLLEQARADLCTETEVDSVPLSLDGRGVQLKWEAEYYVKQFDKK